MITRVVWGRDREGQFTDRLASEYRLECSMDGQSFRPLPTLQERPGADPEIAVKLAALNGDRQKLQAEKKEIGTQRAEIERLPKTWAALSTPPVPLKVLKRGDVLTSGEDAPPGALSAVPLGLSLHAVDIGIPPNAADPARRLRLADWIADEHNPLTWRVIVNRVWHYHFGAGLVTTPSDFGTGGSRPSHPELLDWLAHEFRSGGGHFKALHRMIVRSAVYRQAVPVALGDDHVTHAISIDGDNRLLWRPNRHRLDAEALRDSI